MYRDLDINELYKLYFDVSETINEELEEEFSDGCNEIHLDDLYARQDEIRREILTTRKG